jgi:hypothetical protein
MKIKDVIEGVLSDIYKATQRKTTPAQQPEADYEIPSDIRMGSDLRSQAAAYAHAHDKRGRLKQANIEAELEYLKSKMAGTHDPEKRKELATAFAKKLAQQSSDLGGFLRKKPAATVPAQAGGIPAGTEVTAPGNIIVTKGTDGKWYDPEGSFIGNPSDIANLEKIAARNIATRAGMAQTRNIPTQIPPVRVAPRQKGTTK